jgi:hypothetical protein
MAKKKTARRRPAPPRSKNRRPPIVHTITITDTGGGFSYSIHPPQALPGHNAKKSSVKRKDTIKWVFIGLGDWCAYFKGPTPLDDISNQPLASVSATGLDPANLPAPPLPAYGGQVSAKLNVGDHFYYGVILRRRNGTVVWEDPEIIIESDQEAPPR